MLIEETRTVAVHPVADAQAIATIEAARIAADATRDAASLTGWLTAGSTLAAGIIAASVAGVVAYKVASRQMAIQDRLAHIEATKVRLDLVERRAALIDAISEVSSLLLFIEFRITSKFDLPDTISDDLNSAGERLSKLHDRAMFLFDDRANDVMRMLPDVGLRAITLAGRLEREPHKLSSLTIDPFFIRAVSEAYKLNELSQDILVPMTKPDLDALTSTEVRKPQNIGAIRALSLFLIPASRNKGTASQ